MKYEYQIIISFNKLTAEYGKPLKDLVEAQTRANKLLSTLKATGSFNISITIEKRILKENGNV